MQSPYGARLLPTLLFLTPLPPGFRSLRSHRGSWHLNPRQGPFARVIPPAVPRRPANPLRNARRAGNRRPFEAPTEQPCAPERCCAGGRGCQGCPLLTQPPPHRLQLALAGGRRDVRVKGHRGEGVRGHQAAFLPFFLGKGEPQQGAQHSQCPSVPSAARSPPPPLGAATVSREAGAWVRTAAWSQWLCTPSAGVPSRARSSAAFTQTQPEPTRPDPGRQHPRYLPLCSSPGAG